MYGTISLYKILWMVYHIQIILTEFVDCVVLRVTESKEKVINKTPSFGNRTGSLPQVKN